MPNRFASSPEKISCNDVTDAGPTRYGNAPHSGMGAPVPAEPAHGDVPLSFLQNGESLHRPQRPFTFSRRHKADVRAAQSWASMSAQRFRGAYRRAPTRKIDRAAGVDLAR